MYTTAPANWVKGMLGLVCKFLKMFTISAPALNAILFIFARLFLIQIASRISKHFLLLFFVFQPM